MEKIKELEDDKVANMLYIRYDKMLLSKQITAQIMGISVSSLDRRRKLGTFIKPCMSSENGDIKYSIFSISEFIKNNNIQTI